MSSGCIDILRDALPSRTLARPRANSLPQRAHRRLRGAGMANLIDNGHGSSASTRLLKSASVIGKAYERSESSDSLVGEEGEHA
jgi:hypothetical protein